MDFCVVYEVNVMSLETLKASKKVIGIKQTLKAVNKESVSLVYVAENADERLIRPLQEACETQGVAVQVIPTMLELGKACGIEVGAAAVGVVKG